MLLLAAPSEMKTYFQAVLCHQDILGCHSERSEESRSCTNAQDDSFAKV